MLDPLWHVSRPSNENCNRLFILWVLVQCFHKHDSTCGLGHNELQSIFGSHAHIHMDFRGGSVLKNPPAMQEPQEMRIQFLGCWEDPLEKGLATHSSIPAWRVPWIEEPGGLQSLRLQKLRDS